MKSIFLVTGEASGDAIGAGVAKRIVETAPEVSLGGIGGERMRAAGVPLWADSGEWAAIGIAQALPMAARLVALQRRLKRMLGASRPDVLALVDFGAFNVRLGRWARGEGIRTVYVVPPGSWRRSAKPEKLRRLAGAADLFLTPFPWNVGNLESVGARAVHTGHPALDLSRPGPDADKVRALRNGGRRIIALLPGSRRHEVETLAPLMARVARDWPDPDDRFVVALAPSFPEARLRDLMRDAGDREIAILRVTAADVFAASDLALVCSGTATLEAAIAGVPMVVVYDGPGVMRAEWRLRRRWLHIENLALPNVIAGRRIVPEIIAEDCTPEKVGSELVSLMSDEERLERMRRDLAGVKAQLGPPGALATVADHLLREAGIAPPGNGI